MAQSFDLTGAWEFKEYPLTARRMRDLDLADWLPTSVPSSIFTSLIAADQIKQTDIDTWPEKFDWVSEKPWIFRKIFDAPPAMLESDRVELVFDGLDTITSIWLNDKLIGRTNNMFVPFRFDVTSLLKKHNNSLLVKFEPAAAYAKNLMNRYTVFDESDFRSPHRVYIRKAQYQFGWDFCPALPGCGIWRQVRLEGIKKARLADINVRTVDCNQNCADIKIAVTLDTQANETFHCELSLSTEENTIEHTLIFNSGENFHTALIRVEKPALWWPAGYGQQNLYKLNVKLRSENEIIDQRQNCIGIRTARLNRSSDENGEKFQFEINGQAIFAKGANWIPASIFAGSTADNESKKLLQMAAEANINMLRVWAGGYYETPDFYSLCDKLGIMVWQDFMFSCAYYPDRQWFLEDVKKEAEEVIKQLRNHPCLVLWCGNSEIDSMHAIGKLGKSKKFYGKEIYHKILPQLVAELNPDSDYIPTTPLKEKDKDVWTDHQSIQNYVDPIYPIAPFVTEFGFQSLPEISTIKHFCPPEYSKNGNRLLENHNYQADGNSRLYRYIGDLFGSAENLVQFIYFSQLSQARAAKLYVEHLRANNNSNSGVLFWQFNDCCPAISWSAVDYMNTPKAIYYYAKRFFSRILVATVSEFEKSRLGFPPQLQSLGVTVINESNHTVTATLKCQLMDLFGHNIDEVRFPVMLAPFSSLTTFKLPKIFISPAEPEKVCLSLVIEREGQIIAENLYFYLPDKYTEWPKVQITRQVRQIKEDQWRILLNSNAVARDVRVCLPANAHLSDNFFDLLPNRDYEIEINSSVIHALTEKAIQICHIANPNAH